MKTRILMLCLTLLLSSGMTPDQQAVAREVTLQQKGITLNANLEVAPGSKIKDGVILILHGGLAHHRMELISYVQELLKERGHNSLAITLSLGISKRQGMFNCKQTHTHLHEDALVEIDAWLDWLKKKGAGKVTLFGHSRGGAQIALYMAARKHSLIENAVLLAPATRLNGGAGYHKRYQQALQPILSRARKLVETGKGDTVLEHTNMLFCRDARVSAKSFVSYYGQDERLDSPALLAQTRIPTLIVIAGNDRIVTGLGDRLSELDQATHLSVEVVDGSGHFFRDLNSDDAIDIIDAYLRDHE